MLKISDKLLKTSRVKNKQQNIRYRKTKIITTDLLCEIKSARREWNAMFKILKKKMRIQNFIPSESYLFKTNVKYRLSQTYKPKELINSTFTVELFKGHPSGRMKRIPETHLNTKITEEHQKWKLHR